MKILQLIYESIGSPFGFGGAGVRAYEIYKRLKDRHEITLLCMKYPGARDGEIEGLRHIFIGTESRSLTRSVLSYTLKTSNYVRKYGDNFDVIVENFLPATPFFSKFLTKTPVILQIQGIMGSHSLKKFNPLCGIPMYIMEKVYPRLHDRFIFVTDANADKIMKHSHQHIGTKEHSNGCSTGVQPILTIKKTPYTKAKSLNPPKSPFSKVGFQKIPPLLKGGRDNFIKEEIWDSQRKKNKIYSLIPNGIDRELLNINRKEGDYILFLSRIDIYTKGLDTLIDAFRIIADKFKGVRLVLAGYEFNSISTLIKRLPVSLRDRVSYAGFVTGEDKLRLLSSAKVFVLPSRHEAHPVCVLEALACGKAVVVSDIPELRYIKDKEIGLSFRNGSSQDLADGLCILLEDGELRQSLGVKGQMYASQFLWDNIAIRFENFLLEVINEEK